MSEQRVHSHSRTVSSARPAPTIQTHGRSRNQVWYQNDQAPSDITPKPPYRVPSMAEINATQTNDYVGVSLFSGCGGSCLGFKIDGYRILWANEFIPAAAETYRANHPDVILDTRDIRTIQASDILSAIGRDIDILEGSPPCASFSTAGKREASWGKVKPYSDTKQRTDDLFFEFARLLKGLQPRVFVAENVSGLVKGVAKGYFLDILKALKDCGYVVKAKLLDAQWLGVPQMRQRIIFVGVRNDLGLSPAFPTPLPYRYSVREAIPWIVRQGDNGGFGSGAMRQAVKPSGTIGTGPQAGNVRYPPALVEVEINHRAYRDKRGAFGNDGDCTETPAPTVLADSVGTHWIETESDISPYAIGREWDRLQPGASTFYGARLWKPDTDTPCPTVTQTGGQTGAASVTHPTERRKFSIEELKRICGFPDDFILTGTYAQQWERLGRAVPPVMMARIARTIRTDILDRIPK